MLEPKLQELSQCLLESNAEAIKQLVHFMAPQLDFFGRPQFAAFLKELNISAKVQLSEKLKKRIRQELDEITKGMALLERFVQT